MIRSSRTGLAALVFAFAGGGMTSGQTAPPGVPAAPAPPVQPQPAPQPPPQPPPFLVPPPPPLVAPQAPQPATPAAAAKLFGNWYAVVNYSGMAMQLHVAMRADGTYRSAVSTPYSTVHDVGRYSLDSDGVLFSVSLLTGCPERGVIQWVDDNTVDFITGFGQLVRYVRCK